MVIEKKVNLMLARKVGNPEMCTTHTLALNLPPRNTTLCNPLPMLFIQLTKYKYKINTQITWPI